MESPDDPLRRPDPRMIPYGVGARVPARHADPPSPAQPRESAAPSDDIVVRPFLLTGGRTQPRNPGLRVETLVVAGSGGGSAGLRFEHRRIVDLCVGASSIAEIAAAARMPIGVARILVSDLVADGRLTVLEREELSITLIERIRDRVRAL